MEVLRRKIECIAVFVAAGLIVGCGRDEQGDALGKLYEEDLAFTVDDFLRAAKEGRAHALESYLQAGMEVDAENQFGERALLLAAEYGQRKAVEVLLKAGAGFGIAGPGGRTPLMGAAEAGDAASVRDLLAAGADPARRDQEGWTPLRLAAFYGHGAVVGELLPLTPEGELDSALLLAAMGGDIGVLDRLVEAGANVYRRTPEGQSALMLAAARGHLGAARLLLERGANRFSTDASGKTAADAAEEAGQREVAEELARPPVSDLAGRPMPEMSSADVEQPGTVWQLSGARVDGAKELDRALEIAAYREEQLPVVLEVVEEVGVRARMRQLYGAQRTFWVKVGEQVPDLPFQILAVNLRRGAAKGDGSPTLLQSATVLDLRSGREFVMTPDDPGLSTFTYVDLVDGKGRAFRGRRGDRFEMRAAGIVAPFRILELRPREVLIERLDTGEVVALKKPHRGRI